MELTPIEPDTVPAAMGGYVNALQVRGASRLLFVSGQIPQTRDGQVPDSIEAQCRRCGPIWSPRWSRPTWTLPILVKVTTFLADRAHAAANTAVRNEVLGNHRPALTVVIAGIFDPGWLIEIEAIAAA